ncbi:MAG: IS1182 family transposase [Deltaproteobacteria bacterium]|nr:IS1182 family transposase [Deltaproteobacteria bacterium]
MSYEIRADYSQQYLLPPCVEDWVPEDHPARFIREYVDALDLEALGFKVRKSRDGRPNYGVDLLLNVWLYGYFSRLFSTRKLEQACREHMSLIWLTGNNAPDHNTLWRFFRDNKKSIRKLFKEGVQIAARANLVGMVLHAVDGTKMKAKVATRNGWDRKEMEEVLARLESSLDEAIGEIERLEEEETGEYRLPEGLEDRGKLREMIKEALNEMDEAGRAHLHPNDKEARIMKGDGWKRFAYNAQAVVDEESGFITGEDVVNDEADAHLLTPMVKEVAENLGASPDETVADGGYFSGEELDKAEKEGYGVLVSMGNRKKNGKYHASRFTYDTQRDVCICPMGMELKYEHTKRAKGNRYFVRVYRCQKFKTCSCRNECSKDKKGRSIEIGEYHEAVTRQREKQKDEAKIAMLKKRKAIVERIFGQIKEGMGFRRFTVNGLEGVRTQWSLLCTVVNLKKLHKWWLEGKFSIEGDSELKDGADGVICA